MSGLRPREADPFDTSICTDINLGPSRVELHLIEAEILGEDRQEEAGEKSNLDLLCEEVPEVQKKEEEPLDESVDPFDTSHVDGVVETDADPFDTKYVEGLLPNKGDPFDTSFIKVRDVMSG